MAFKAQHPSLTPRGAPRSARHREGGELKLPDITMSPGRARTQLPTPRALEAGLADGQPFTKKEVVALRRAQAQLQPGEDEKLASMRGVVQDMLNVFDDVQRGREALHKLREMQHQDVLSRIEATRAFIKKKAHEHHKELGEYQKQFTRHSEEMAEEYRGAIGKAEEHLGADLSSLRERGVSLGEGIQQERQDREAAISQAGQDLHGQVAGLQAALQAEVAACADAHQSLRLSLENWRDDNVSSIQEAGRELADRSNSMFIDWRSVFSEAASRQQTLEDQLHTAMDRLNDVLGAMAADRQATQGQLVNNLVGFLGEFEKNVRSQAAAEPGRQEAVRQGLKATAQQLDSTLVAQ
mmetsp:Transcript_77690/g.207554  ORF Transcript_77690/g.207554 Transcript_77690/m.207554 type:complete len:353 (+) Transcript_77690:28-1086(+)